LTWMRGIRLALALVGGMVTLLAAIAGGLFMSMGWAERNQSNSAPLPWPQAAYFPMLLAAAALALAAGPVMHWRPRLGALLGFAAVVLGAIATVLCTYAVRDVLREWFVVTAPVTIATLMGLVDNGSAHRSDDRDIRVSAASE